MNDFVAGLSLKIKNIPTDNASTFYSPPSWPPPLEWAVSFDSRGNPVSVWGDVTWDFSAWAGFSCRVSFLKSRTPKNRAELDPRNCTLLRLVATYLIWGPRGIRSWLSLRNVFNLIRRLVAYCDVNKIYAGDLYRFPKIYRSLGDVFAHDQERRLVVQTLHRLLLDSENLGLKILDEYALAQLVKIFKEYKSAATEQTAYIPPRIWLHQVSRLRECLDDFLLHAEKFGACYNFCLDAYVNNYGSLQNSFTKYRGSKNHKFLPFGNAHIKNPQDGLVYPGTFEDTASDFGVLDLLKKWVAPKNEVLSIKSLSTYAGLIQIAAVIYICNFTLQRKEEAADLRIDCLIWDDDPILGKVAIIRGETTKTDPDSDARWPASPSVEAAVSAGSFLAKLRMRCVEAQPAFDPKVHDVKNPTILQHNVEPWSGRWNGTLSYRVSTHPYKSLVTRFPKLFDAEILRIREEDLRIVRMFTPNIDGNGDFMVGKSWPFAFHQLRRTTGINMFASGILSASSMQVIMKHLTILQTMYYGRHFSSARFNEEVEGVTSYARFEVLAKQVEALMDERYVSPHGASRKSQIIVNLIDSRDYKKLVKAGECGEISFRETRLGGCTKNGYCDYGGIESVASCAGYEGRKACTDAIFDKTRRVAVQVQLRDVEDRIVEDKNDSPRRRALVAEAQGMRSYLDVTGQ
ncbi:hypothetical protein D3C71_951220 [compost metagenome]